MTEPTESFEPTTQQTSLKRNWRAWVLGTITVGVLGAAGTLGYSFWKMQSEDASLPNQPLLTHNVSANTASSSMPDPAHSSSLMRELLTNMLNQATVIQLLLNNQQFSLAMSLLSILEAELVQLPLSQQQAIQTAIVADSEKIQYVQTNKQQVLGQVQQLQQHINQQMLAHFGPVTETPAPTTTAPADETLVDKLKHQFQNAVQVQHSDALTDSALPAFYGGVMLQLAMYQAQFALMQGNAMEYQLALNSATPWVTQQSLSWLSDRESVSQTINQLSQQPLDFSGANVNQTQQALITATQELTP